jgi:DNA topoisomerase-2
MCYNPIQIISYLEAKLNSVSEVDLKALLIEPYYQGFKGKIYPCDTTHKKYIIKGCYETIGPDKIRISELPVGTWTQDYKEFLEGILDAKSSKSKSSKCNDEYVKDFVDMSTDINVDFEVSFYPGILSKLVSEDHDYGINGLEKYLKLYTSQCTSNMHLFNEKEQLHKYDNVYAIIDTYYVIRYDYYAKRKKYIIQKIERELKVLSNKARFIQYNLDDKIDLRKKSKDAIYKIMEDFKFDLGETHDYNYLVKMPMDSVCKENVEKLLNEHELKKNELASISACSLEHMWLKELDALKIAYSQFLESNVKSEDKAKKSKKQK